jgi:fructokinase
MRVLFGCIEAGGTKFDVAIGDESGAILDTARFATLTPEETLGPVLDWLARQAPLSAIGVASFGPLYLDRSSPSWGKVARTPKPEWSGTDLAGPLGARFGVPIGFDTDVNAAALAESRWGECRSDEICVYMTIGTGIGGGVVVNGRPLHGHPHPEFGHALARRYKTDTYKGCCPYHGDCFEGLASGTAIAGRWGASLAELPPDHPAHDMAAWYVAQLCVMTHAVLSPRTVLLGGGVMAAPNFLEHAQRHVTAMTNDYFTPILNRPALGDRAGILGALALAHGALEGASL